MQYPGGKNAGGAYQTIINQMPPHRCYIEPFIGSGAVMRYKKPTTINLALDANPDIVDQRTQDLPKTTLVLHQDALQYLAELQPTPDTLIYLDPPYLKSTRRGLADIYPYEFTDTQHHDLLNIITKLPCLIILSGYHSDLYSQHLSTWRTLTYTAMTRAGEPATEYLWLNYPEPIELHDYTHLGQNFRERERIKRKRSRWLNKLRTMPPAERHSLIQAIADYRAEQAQPKTQAGHPRHK
jgi:hypothetical protein